MKSEIIFCPKCNTLLLEAPQCRKCGWKRPTRPPGEDKRLLWETRYMEGVSSGLTWAQRLLIFMDGQGRLRALHVDSMEEVWNPPLDLGQWRIYERVTVNKNIVALGTTDDAPLTDADKVVITLDITTGKEIWRQNLHESHISDTAIDGDKVFVATSSNQAVALRLADGEMLWQQPISGLYKAAPATYGNLVYFGGNQGILTALHQEDGTVAWTYQVEAFRSWLPDIPYAPVAADGVLYFTSWNRKTYALDAVTGEVIWISDPTQKRPPLASPLVEDDAVYVIGDDRYVYFLDRSTGQERWRTKLPKRSKIPPLLVDDVLIVAARDHHVYALDAATGERLEAPILTTGGKVSKPWDFDGEVLYLADDLGKVYAVRLVEEPEEAVDPAALMQAGKWEAAAVAWALQGEYAQAAKIYAEQLEQPQRAAQLYEKAGDALLAAVQYEQAGDLKQALELYRQARAWDKVAALAERLEDLLTAAQAYEHLEQWNKAGEFYFELGKHAQAVALYEQAAIQARERGDKTNANNYLDWAVKMYTKYLKQPAKAVVLLDEFGRKEEAKALLQTIPDWKNKPKFRELLDNLTKSPQERAQIYEKDGALRLAAREYIQAGEHERAADLLARAGEFKLAAEQYQLANLPVKAAEMMIQMQNWDEVAELYLQAERYQDAVQAFLKAGDIRSAAELFEQLEQWDEAATRWQQLDRWENAAIAWEKAKEFVKAAEAWIEEGELIKAAQNYEKAAHQLALKGHRNVDAEALARLYELAMKQYLASGDKSKADFCDGRRRRYRRQPLIQVVSVPGRSLNVNDWGKLDVIIVNKGWGQARDVDIRVDAQYFELDTSRLEQLIGLGKNVEARYTLWLKPKDAGTVPLHLTITYTDQKGRPMPALPYDTDVHVHRSDSLTPHHQIYNIYGGDVIHGKNVQKGDRVEVKREVGSRGVSLESDDESSSSASSLRSPPANPVPTIECAYCGKEQPATNLRCENPDCEQIFVRCPSCGLYQPRNERDPEQFCMFCGVKI